MQLGSDVADFLENVILQKFDDDCVVVSII